MPWIRKHYKKSRRTATNYMQIGRRCITESKLASTCQFAALTMEVSKILEQVGKGSLDLSHPIIGIVADWTAGRSAYQLQLEIGDAPKGGKRVKKAGGEESDEDTNPDQAAAIAIWKPILAKLQLEGIDEKSFAHLSMDYKRAGRGLLVDLLKIWPK